MRNHPVKSDYRQRQPEQTKHDDKRCADADKQQGAPAQARVHRLKVVNRHVLIQRANGLTRGGCDGGRIAFGVQEKNRRRLVILREGQIEARARLFAN